MTSGVTSASAFCSAGVAAGPEIGFALAQRRDLPRFEIGLGDDVAVHLDQNLLEDVASRASAERDEQHARSDHGPTLQ